MASDYDFVAPAGGAGARAGLPLVAAYRRLGGARAPVRAGDGGRGRGTGT